MNVTKDIKYIGVNDRDITLFEGQFMVEKGMAYNSYLIIDEKIAVMDSVGGEFGDEWLGNITSELDGKAPDYLVVQHMEPDHSANIARLAEAYPAMRLVSTAKAFKMMEQFFGTDFAERQVVVGEGDTLSLGKHTLNFVTAPMVHWPEVMVSYDSLDKVLFSADAFGKFGTTDADEDWACEARRYYFGIVGKYGAQVQTLLKKAAALDISVICPLHGPVLSENLEVYINLYNTWSAYEPENKGVLVAYTSVYGGTKKAAQLLKDKLTEYGCEKVAITDLAADDMAEAVEDAFRYDRLVLCTTTYNADIFPYMRTFIEALTERNYQKRTIAFVENGSWAPTAIKVMKGMLEKSKEVSFAENEVHILSALNEKSLSELDELAKELCTR